MHMFTVSYMDPPQGQTIGTLTIASLIQKDVALVSIPGAVIQVDGERLTQQIDINPEDIVDVINAVFLIVRFFFALFGSRN